MAVTGSRHTVAALAARLGLQVHGDPDVEVTGVGTLANAGPGQLSFLANPRYRGQLATTGAAAVVMRPADAEGFQGTAVLAGDPYVAFAKIAARFEPPATREPGIHPAAHVDPGATVDPSASVGPFSSIGARCRVEAGATIGPGCVIGEDCVVGAGTVLVARVTLVARVRLGRRVRIHPGAVLGADGFGLAMDRPEGEEPHWIKVPQLGGVVVGDDCEIGANTCIDRGAIEDTELGRDVRLDNLVQIAHNVRIGDHTAMAGCTAVAGSTRVGRYCMIGGAVGIAGHLEICDRVVVTAMSLVSGSLREPGEYSSGTGLMDNRSWRRNAARFRHLDEMARRLRAMDTRKDNE